MFSLDKLKLKKSGIVVKNQAKKNIKKRLLDIGLTEGCIVKCILESPSKDIKAYLIRGSLIAIRDIDSKNIIMEEYNE